MEKYIKVETYLTLDFKHQIIQHVSKTHERIHAHVTAGSSALQLASALHMVAD